MIPWGKYNYKKYLWVFVTAMISPQMIPWGKYNYKKYLWVFVTAMISPS